MDQLENTMATNHIINSAKSIRVAMMYALLISAIAGFAYGMEVGVVSGALPLITQEFQLSSLMEGWVVGSLMFGAIIGAIVAAPISRLVGRRRALVISSIAFLIGTVLSVFTSTVLLLVIGRIFLGLSVGILTFAAPLYVSEISPEKFRGRAISTFQFMLSFGIFAAFLSNWVLNFLDSWRVMFSILFIPGTLLLIGALLVPKSPRWLVSVGRNDEALSVLTKLRVCPEVAKQELEEIKNNITTENSHKGFKLFLNNKFFRKTVFLGISLQVIQQLTGINIVLIFAPKIFALAGFSGTSAQLFSTMIVGIFFVVTTFISIFIIDKFGRKPMLYSGLSIIVLGLLLLTLGLAQEIASFGLAGIIIFIIGFGLSAGPIVWTLCAEIQPLQGREFGVSCSTFANWVMNFLVATYFLYLNDIFGIVNIFIALAVLNFIFLFFVYFFVPETKNVSLESLERNLMKGERLRNIGYKK
ncbi:sugar porter family MFS transporter [Acinetobacter populi]|uniref:Major facilitator superfamily (MFS) profile domain-containing protein n=1 Tax=Acinetobacter populi TaxID=1582270 RepID=A0A1Z9YUX8_9GAMM|nr:sugar porter family MFS transporter [Acinetobacter populi]OUY05983.1 hypothetical protein CAP51_14825 [Acinetobacter populi]